MAEYTGCPFFKRVEEIPTEYALRVLNSQAEEDEEATKQITRHILHCTDGALTINTHLICLQDDTTARTPANTGSVCSAYATELYWNPGCAHHHAPPAVLSFDILRYPEVQHACTIHHHMRSLNQARTSWMASSWAVRIVVSAGSPLRSVKSSHV